MTPSEAPDREPIRAEQIRLLEPTTGERVPACITSLEHTPYDLHCRFEVWWHVTDQLPVGPCGLLLVVDDYSIDYPILLGGKPDLFVRSDCLGVSLMRYARHPRRLVIGSPGAKPDRQRDLVSSQQDFMDRLERLGRRISRELQDFLEELPGR